MSYTEFNKKIFEHYINRGISTFFSFSVDKSEIDVILEEEEVASFDELQDNWELLMRRADGIPQYFGLIALQCCAAALMQDDGYNTAQAYQVRLRNLLSLEGDNVLQQLFRGVDKENPVQEKIWQDAKTFMKNNFDFHIDLPNQTIYKGRYVQYPISQALLNTEDLKYFTFFFAETFQLGEALPFPYFREKLESCFQNFPVTSRTRKLWKEEAKREKCIAQVFNYYNSWDGSMYELSDKNKRIYSHRKLNSDIYAQKLILLFDEGNPVFYLNNNKIDPINIFSLKNYFYFYSNILLFSQADYYIDEYDSTRFLHVNDTCYVLLNIDKKISEYWFLESNHAESTKLTSNLMLYKYMVSDAVMYNPISKYQSVIDPLVLYGGIKLNRGNAYLEGFGPSILYDKKYVVFYNHYQCEYHSDSAIPGRYRIRTSDYKDVEFTIEVVEQNRRIDSANKGWNLKLLTIDVDPMLEGCLLNINTQTCNDIHPVRAWIDAQLPLPNRKKNNSENILIKAINNSYNEICQSKRNP